MNVHIVTREYASDRILGRLGRMLAESTGWTLGATPNGTADLNHFVCYIEYAEDFNGWHSTPVSAYFTHYDEINEQKQRWWHEAARQVDLRVVTARQYIMPLLEYGNGVLVRPPVDQTVFTPAPKPRPRRNKPIVGISGFVDKASGRKGEGLVAKLRDSELGGKIELIASGQGWPIWTEHTSNPDADLPKFYRSLDVFLCTSLVEGNPLPPLEALACGIPIVIPKGVGMLDDLPGMNGIYRYLAGDFRDLCYVLDTACFGLNEYEPEQLRAAVADYTPENWVEDHQRAFESFLYDVPTFSTPFHGPRGMYCVAYGKRARECARVLIQTFKQHLPDIPVALASIQPLGPEDHFAECPDVDIGARHAKLKIDELAPADWRTVVYFDADIEITAPVYFLWQLVEDGWDFAICKNPGKFHTTRRMKRPDNLDECEVTFNAMLSDDMLQLNGGVFAYQRNERTKEFFEIWHREWERWGKRDQAALLRALWERPLKMVVLTNVWNTVVPYDRPEITAGIMHYPMRARRWSDMVHHRSDSDEAWKAVERFEAKH